MKILATDISTRILEKGRLGIYEAEKVKPVRMELRSRYFVELPTARVATRRLGGEQGRTSNSDSAYGESMKKLNDTDAKFYKVTQELMDMVFFRRLNLSSPPFPMRGPLDAIFCRNVMIYFDRAVRCGLLQEIGRLLKPGGYLFIGHAESLTGLVNNLKSVRPSVYLKG
jgi:chemotaxis protein methyltransferase CheR